MNIDDKSGDMSMNNVDLGHFKKFYLWICWKGTVMSVEGEKEEDFITVHFPDTGNSQGWVRMKPGK